MPDTPKPHTIDLQEAKLRNITARETVAVLSESMTSMSRLWEHLNAALSDTPRLISEITRLRTDIDAQRLSRANLLAAARATLAAQREGEPDPFSYLRDELDAQGWPHGGRP
ncbi:hypothetical protein GCM10009527_047410 [Actinomadura nitritigenes]